MPKGTSMTMFAMYWNMSVLVSMRSQDDGSATEKCALRAISATHLKGTSCTYGRVMARTVSIS